MNHTVQSMLDFIEKSPTPFQAVLQMQERFLAAGYKELNEKQKWTLETGKSYFVTRNHSALIAFTISENYTEKQGFRIVASHCDSPCFKVKENPEMTVQNAYIKLNVEKYGGMLMSTWFDRPLSIAGRVVISKDGQIEEIPVHIDRDLLLIPNLAIHMNRKANDGVSYNAQKDMLPLIGLTEDAQYHLLEMIASELEIEEKDILAHDLFLYNRMPGTVWGAHGEFVSSPRLDDLQCVYGSMEAYLKADKHSSIAVHCVLDNEEVGSSTKQGAASTFLKDTMKRIMWGLGMEEESYYVALANSFMISADNAHAAHPNYSETADPTNRPIMNRGIVIKYNANQKYCTDSVSASKFINICREAEVPYQTFTNRSDIAGGSTLGNISNTQVPMDTVDIGLPQLAMHSSYETAGVKDIEYLIKAFRKFWE